MRRVRRVATLPERLLCSELRRLGLRFRVDRAPIEGMRSRADLVFDSAKVAVFVDGCFWHGCPEHATWPTANAHWWKNKIESNRKRDHQVTARLETAGWLVVRIWEHDARDAGEAVALMVRRRRKGRGSVKSSPPASKSLA